MNRLVAFLAILAAALAVLVVVALSHPADASSSCPSTDRAAFRLYDQQVRAGQPTQADRDAVRAAVIRDYVACQVTR